MKKGLRRRTKIVWKKQEIPYCEIDHVEFPKRIGEPFVICMTPRGEKEYRCRERQRKAEQARIKRDIRLHKYGVDINWFLFGPFRSDGSPVFS